MKTKSVNKLFARAAADSKITKAEAKQIAAQVKQGKVTKAEKTAVRQQMNLHADEFAAGAKKPLQKLLGKSQSASTDSGAPAGGGGSSSISQSIGNSIPNGYGLTDAQRKLFEDSGVDPNSTEGKSMKLQMMMANYKNNMETVSNVGKMLTELSSSIVRNIRA